MSPEPRRMRPARMHSTNFGERMLLIRQRVADGAYNDAAVIAVVARAVLDTRDFR